MEYTVHGSSAQPPAFPRRCGLGDRNLAYVLVRMIVEPLIGKAIKGNCGHRLSDVLQELGFTLGRDRLRPVRRFLTGADQHKSTGKAQKPSLPHGIALSTRQYGRLGFDYYCGLLPSVAQPPFPLHEFLPGCLPPPWPLQSF